MADEGISFKHIVLNTFFKKHRFLQRGFGNTLPTSIKNQFPRYYGLNCVLSPKFICSSLPVLQNMTIFGDRAFREIIQVK
jgi:hypothetical protein